MQIISYKRAQRKMEEEMRSIMNELASHKTALKQLQDSFFDKVRHLYISISYPLSLVDFITLMAYFSFNFFVNSLHVYRNSKKS